MGLLYICGPAGGGCARDVQSRLFRCPASPSLLYKNHSAPACGRARAWRRRSSPAASTWSATPVPLRGSRLLFRLVGTWVLGRPPAFPTAAAPQKKLGRSARLACRLILRPIVTCMRQPLLPPFAVAVEQRCAVNFALKGKGANPVTCGASGCEFRWDAWLPGLSTRVMPLGSALPGSLPVMVSQVWACMASCGCFRVTHTYHLQGQLHPSGLRDYAV